MPDITEKAVILPSEPAALPQVAPVEEPLTTWKCTCGMTWTGKMNSVQYESYQSHVRRHFHARLPGTRVEVG